jgi:hypothetical protein
MSNWVETREAASGVEAAGYVCLMGLFCDLGVIDSFPVLVGGVPFYQGVLVAVEFNTVFLWGIYELI